LVLAVPSIWVEVQLMGLQAHAETGNTVMHELPVGESHRTLYAALRAAGAGLAERNHAGETPLHRAAGAGDLHLVQLMLLDGADASSKNHSGGTPMHAAAAVEDATVAPALVQVLAQHGGRADAPDEEGVIPLDIARARGPAGQPIVVRPSTLLAPDFAFTHLPAPNQVQI
jgi:ankyrin repeat protein